jgi:pimeloyl-ACP methyl ester carboxylesterase
VGHRAEVESGSLVYDESGSGEAVVLLHGGMLDRTMWDGHLERLADRYHVIRYDARGHGESSVATGPYSHYGDLGMLLDVCGVERATLIGLSLGARTAIDFTLAFPGRVERLVLAGPGMSGMTFEDPAVVAGNEEQQRLAAARDAEGFVELFLRLWVDGPRRGPGGCGSDVRRRCKEMAMRTLPKLATGTAWPTELDAWARIGELGVPVLAIAGDEDSSDVHRVVQHVAANVPGARTVTLPGVAHMVNMEQPAAFDAAVDAFLAGR